MLLIPDDCNDLLGIGTVECDGGNRFTVCELVVQGDERKLVRVAAEKGLSKPR